MNFNGLGAFAAFLGTRRIAAQAAQQKGEEAAAAMLVESAKAMIGEEMRQWADLAPATVENKQALGQTGRVSDTDPLYATGELRISIGAHVAGNTVILGSTDPIAPLHEFGTSRMPPRPFIGATIFREGKPAADLIAGHIVAAVANRPPPKTPTSR